MVRSIRLISFGSNSFHLLYKSVSRNILQRANSLIEKANSVQRNAEDLYMRRLKMVILLILQIWRMIFQQSKERGDDKNNNLECVR